MCTDDGDGVWWSCIRMLKGRVLPEGRGKRSHVQMGRTARALCVELTERWPLAAEERVEGVSTALVEST